MFTDCRECSKGSAPGQAAVESEDVKTAACSIPGVPVIVRSQASGSSQARAESGRSGSESWQENACRSASMRAGRPDARGHSRWSHSVPARVVTAGGGKSPIAGPTLGAVAALACHDRRRITSTREHVQALDGAQVRCCSRTASRPAETEPAPPGFHCPWRGRSLVNRESRVVWAMAHHGTPPTASVYLPAVANDDFEIHHRRR